MRTTSITTQTLPQDALLQILGRETVLWLADPSVSDHLSSEELGQLIALPWLGVFCESTSSALYKHLESKQDSKELARLRGFVHLVASDPALRLLPARALPVFFLNGVDQAAQMAESSSLAGRPAQRRRLNMLAQLSALSPKRVVIIGPNAEAALNELADLWQSEFRCLVTLVLGSDRDSSKYAEAIGAFTDLHTISVVVGPLRTALLEVAQRAERLLSESRIRILVRTSAQGIAEQDITESELVERPILTNFDLVEARHTVRLGPDNLTEDDFRSFFDTGTEDWKCYAAGLPWIPDKTCVRDLLVALEKTRLEGATSNKVLTIVSEPGAGGTTLARALALEAAREGYPALLAKKHLLAPNATEIETFLYRVLQEIHRAPESDGSEPSNPEPAWLLVLDTTHFDRQPQDLAQFVNEIARKGRSVVVLKVVPSDAVFDLPTEIHGAELAYVQHDLDKETVLDLGRHLNRFLKVYGKQKGDDEWLQFWNQHRPDIDTGIASFWIALEFWLGGYLELGESIQGWLHRHFAAAPFSAEVKRAILELAAFSIERRAIPERLLPILSSPSLPWSLALEEARTQLPAAGLVQGSTSDGRLWALAHDVLGRHLINAAYGDRQLLHSLGLANAKSAVALRLDLIRDFAQRTALGEKVFLQYAIALAFRVLKMDERDGNPEFFPYWKDVIQILDLVPASVRQTSRTFNHHFAISRRRIAKSDVFQATDDEKREQLLAAIESLEFALNRIEPTPEDEQSLNLFNSLALAFQDLAELEQRLGSSREVIRSLLARSDDATRAALKENPNNPYVLETAAKNLIQKGKYDNSIGVVSAVEAFSYVFQASTLENSVDRQGTLARLAVEALKLMRGADASVEISALCSSGNPFGFLAKAWLTLVETQDLNQNDWLGRLDFSRADEALSILRGAPSRHWLAIRLEYDLECAVRPLMFERQLGLLDELEHIPGHSLPIQQRLERAILLHLERRHGDANSEFQRVRREIKSLGTIVHVPDRLRWLLTADRQRRQLCTARVVEQASGRWTAQVQDLSRALVPFVPQDFGKQRFAANETFKCFITFGPMGPFIKAPDAAQRIR